MAKAKESFTMLRKITVKDCVGDVPKLFRESVAKDAKLKRLELVKVTGIVQRTATVPTSYGESTRLIGDFAAINMISGEVFRSNRCYLPDVVSETIAGSLAGVKSTDTQAVIEFGYLISILPDASVQSGYVYHAEPFIEAAESNRLGKLMETMGVQKALPDQSKKGK